MLYVITKLGDIVDFIFSVKKAVAASSFLANEAGGSIEIAYLLKALYLSREKPCCNGRGPLWETAFSLLSMALS